MTDTAPRRTAQDRQRRANLADAATGPDVDVAAVQHLISEALSATGVLPRQTRITELHEQLHAEIRRLIPTVQQRLDDAVPRSPEWYALDKRLDRAHDVLRYPLPTTPLAGSIHVAELARRLVALKQAEGVQP